jgi:hypothetical protein
MLTLESDVICPYFRLECHLDSLSLLLLLSEFSHRYMWQLKHSKQVSVRTRAQCHASEQVVDYTSTVPRAGKEV